MEGGLFSITTALNRTHTEPYIRSQPHGWHACRYKNEIEYAQHVDRTRKDAIHRNPSVTIHAKVKEENNNWAGGGVPDHAPADKLARYDPFHHQWYHTVTRMRSSPIVGPSTAEVTRKARDHIGYDNGAVGYGDIQCTAVSYMSPFWFGPFRMVEGPCTNLPNVPRCPHVDIKDRKLKINYRQYKRGPNLSNIETPFFLDGVKTPNPNYPS